MEIILKNHTVQDKDKSYIFCLFKCFNLLIYFLTNPFYIKMIVIIYQLVFYYYYYIVVVFVIADDGDNDDDDYYVFLYNQHIL